MTLKRGSRGEKVRYLQEQLSVDADGIFGRKTETALKEFQAAHGLTADGICGPKTWAALGGEPVIKGIVIECDDLKQAAKPHGAMKYGKTTYKSGGCGPTSLAIVHRAYGLCPEGETGTQTIQRLGKYAEEHGYRTVGGTSAGLFKTNGTTYEQTTARLKIEDALRAGHLVILNVKKGFPNGYSGDGHYLVAYGIVDDTLLLRDVGSSAASRQRCALDRMTTGLKNGFIIKRR